MHKQIIAPQTQACLIRSIRYHGLLDLGYLCFSHDQLFVRAIAILIFPFKEPPRLSLGGKGNQPVSVLGIHRVLTLGGLRFP